MVSEGPHHLCLATACGLIPCCHLHPDRHPPSTRLIFPKQPCHLFDLMLPTEAASSSCPQMNFSSLPSMPTHPFHSTQCLLFRWQFHTQNWPHPPFPTPSQFPHEAQQTTLLSVPHLRVCAHAVSLPLYPCPSFKDQSSSCLFSYVFP